MNPWKRLGLVLGAEFALAFVGLAFFISTMYQYSLNSVIGFFGLGFVILAWFSYRSLPYHQKAIAIGCIVYPIGLFVILMIVSVLFYDDPNATHSDDSFWMVIMVIMIGIFGFGLVKYPGWLLPTLQPETVIELTDQLLQWFPNQVFWLRHRAHAYSRLNKYEEAQSALNRAVEQRPKDVKLLAQRITVNMARYDYAAVLVDAEHIEDINPNTPFNSIYSVSALTDLRRYDEAFAVCNRAIDERKTPLEQAFLLAGRAELFRIKGDLDAAENALTQIELEKIPKQQRNALQMVLEANYGYLALVRDQLVEAESHFQAALGLVQHLPQALVSLAIIHSMQGNEDKAQHYWQTLVREHPKYADTEWVMVVSHLPERYQKIIAQIAQA